MRSLIIDGKFLLRQQTGVQRFAREILNELCNIEGLHIILALEKGAEPEGIPQNAEVVHFGAFKGNLWEQISLPRYCKKRKFPLLCPANIAPFGSRQSVVLHDVTFREKETFAPSGLWTLKMRMLVGSYIYRAKHLFTVSEFSRDRIMALYPKLKTPPTVVRNGYEHMLKIAEDDSLSKKVQGEFYFSVGSVHPNKNFQYILELARQNPQTTFVIAGDLSGKNAGMGSKNCIFTGYVTDGQLKWLYKNCKGFILPSLYEGFGVPPLEAVACGCRKLFLSNIPAFKEVYGDCATFFDPRDLEHTVPLDGEDMTEEQASVLLESCSYKRSAEIIANQIFAEGNK